VQSDTDGIGENGFPEKREWAEANGSGFHLLEAAVANRAAELMGVMPFRLKP
jgi:hypothetical protein